MRDGFVKNVEAIERTLGRSFSGTSARLSLACTADDSRAELQVRMDFRDATDEVPVRHVVFVLAVHIPGVYSDCANTSDVTELLLARQEQLAKLMLLSHKLQPLTGEDAVWPLSDAEHYLRHRRAA